VHAFRPPAPAPPGSAPAPSPLWLSDARCRTFGGSSASARHPMLRTYLSDMVRPYRVPLAEDVLAAGGGHSYGEMAGALLAEMLPAAPPIDLLVFAFSVHDVVPGRATAAHLSHLCPGSPMAFAVCDQGAAAPFTGLRLLWEYTRGGGCQRALLVVAEQAVLPYQPPAPAVVPARHAAVALLYGPAGSGRIEPPLLHADVDPGQAGSLLAAGVAAANPDGGELTVVTGGGLAGHAATLAGLPGVGEVVAARPDQPCTGVWWELAERRPGWLAAGRRVLLAEYEPELRYLCLAAVDVTASGPTAHSGRKDAPTRSAPQSPAPAR
jgi:hypothetical protein